MNNITDTEQTVLDRIMTANRNEDVIEKEAKAVARKIRQRRKMTATYKAHKALETLHAEQYERLFTQAYAELGSDERYVEIV